MGSGKKECKGYHKPFGILLNDMGKHPPEVEVVEETKDNNELATAAGEH